jgi:multicomponent Na+:H+ antiporter subunit E
LLLTLLWVLAWGELSVWNVVTGAALASALLIAFPPRRQTRVTLRLGGFVRLLAYLLRELVTSNLLVSREALSRSSRVRTGVLAYPVEQSSEELLALMANVIALTPGTMTVEVTHDPGTLYAHFLLLDDVGEARRRLARLERMCRGALGEGEPEPLTKSTSEETR